MRNQEAMFGLRLAATAALTLFATSSALGQAAPKTLVAVFAHADDEVPAGPILARYAREGVQVHLIIATDGAQGGANTSIPRGPELAKVRAEEAACSAKALGIHPPILLGFPDGALGNYPADPGLLFRLTQRVHEELQRLKPDALITWGPDGGTGHPDHRLVSDIVTQLVRAGAPGVPEHVFYAYIPAEGFRAMNPARGTPPLMLPLAKYFTVRVSFTATDFDAARRSMSCHRTQYPEDVVQRVTEASRQLWNGAIAFVPLFPTSAGTELLSPR
jgi:LmbE family N-acetylglucosaminyl deacetylase